MAPCNKPYTVKSDNPKMSSSVKPMKSYMGGGMVKSYQKGGVVKGDMPDLTGDGKITRADVLKGRGVFKDGGMIKSYQKGGMITSMTTRAQNPRAYPGQNEARQRRREREEMLIAEAEGKKMTRQTQQAYESSTGRKLPK